MVRRVYPCEVNFNVPDATAETTVAQQKMLFMQDQMRKLSQSQGMMEGKKQNDEAKHELKLENWSSLDECEKQNNETGFQEAAQQTSNEYMYVVT